MIVYLSLGSNLGKRELNLQNALSHIQGFALLTKASSVYETVPQYDLDQPYFLNQVVEIETDLLPRELLRKLKAIEIQLGRQPTHRFGPRLIDIDILYYGQECVDSLDLTIPHPSISERDFVLKPLCEIAPNFVCPRTGMTAHEMLELLGGTI